MSTHTYYPQSRIFKASTIDAAIHGWIVDLSPVGMINPDCYWPFNTRQEGRNFLRLVNAGYEPVEAETIVIFGDVDIDDVIEEDYW